MLEITDKKQLYYLDNISIELLYLNKKINEELVFNNLDENSQLEILYYIEKGRTCLENYDFINSLNYFETGLYKTNNNIFNYYIGKVYYKINDYKKAFQYLKEYSIKGAKKYTKAKIYMWAMYRQKYQFNEANKLVTEIAKINELEGNCFNYKTLISYDLHKIYEDKFDMKPKRLLKKIKIREEDFLIKGDKNGRI